MAVVQLSVFSSKYAYGGGGFASACVEMHIACQHTKIRSTLLPSESTELHTPGCNHLGAACFLLQSNPPHPAHKDALPGQKLIHVHQPLQYECGASQGRTLTSPEKGKDWKGCNIIGINVWFQAIVLSKYYWRNQEGLERDRKGISAAQSTQRLLS